MKRIACIAALLASALIGTQAHAQSRVGGGYIGIGAMSVLTDNAEEFAALVILPPGAGQGDSSATGLKIYGGYVWPTRFGIEVGYYDLGTYDVRTNGVKSDEFQTSAVTVSGTYNVALAPQLDLLLKLGLAFTTADYSCITNCGGFFTSTSKQDISGLMGIGLGWRIAPAFSLRGDFEYFGAVTHSVGGVIAEYPYTVLSISGQFHF